MLRNHLTSIFSKTSQWLFKIGQNHAFIGLVWMAYSWNYSIFVFYICWFLTECIVHILKEYWYWILISSCQKKRIFEILLYSLWICFIFVEVAFMSFFENNHILDILIQCNNTFIKIISHKIKVEITSLNACCPYWGRWQSQKKTKE